MMDFTLALCLSEIMQFMTYWSNGNQKVKKSLQCRVAVKIVERKLEILSKHVLNAIQCMETSR